MTEFQEWFGYPYNRRFGLKIAEVNWKEGDRVGVGPFKNKL
jgi:hypothetical protein